MLPSTSADSTRSLMSSLEQCIPRIQAFYPNIARIRQDTQALFFNMHSLKPNVGSFKTNNGASVTLFYLSGVVPITYQNAKYNIPVTIYFDPPYPNQPPRVFVTPTADMVIKQNHRSVDQNGRVYIPQLSGWNAYSSSLVDVVAMLSSTFSVEPPVNSVKRASVVQPAQQPMGNSSLPATIVSNPAAGAIMGAAVVGTAAAMLSSSRKQILINSLNGKISAKLRVRLAREVDQINACKMDYAKLLTQKDKVYWLLLASAKTTAEGNKIKSNLAALQTDTESWIHANRHTSEDEFSSAKTVAYLESSSVVGQQVIDCMAEICAIEDLIDHLQELHRGGRISMADRLREVRLQTRKVFELKALQNKAVTVLQSAGH